MYIIQTYLAEIIDPFSSIAWTKPSICFSTTFGYPTTKENRKHSTETQLLAIQCTHRMINSYDICLMQSLGRHRFDFVEQFNKTNVV